MNEIIHNADTALYHSKLSGRNRACAYTNEAYIDLVENRSTDKPAPSSAAEIPPLSKRPIEEGSNISHQEMPDESIDHSQVREYRSDSDEIGKPAKSNILKSIVNYYIGLVTIASLLFFVATYKTTMPTQLLVPASEWISLFIISALIAMSEWYSVNLYFRQTAISTSAIPILVGYLLFGLVGTLVVSLAVAIALFLKYRSPISRFFFNFSNHMLAGTLCGLLLSLTGKPFLELSPTDQMVLCLISVIVMYLTTTWLIAVGMSFDLRQPAQQIWNEQYSWLALYYLGFGLMAYTLIIGFKYDQNTGILLMVLPMVFLRLSQIQYIAHTKKAVVELREKNQTLKKNTEEITELNEGLLEILSEIIDLRDPHLLGHSKQVTSHAVAIARSMKLNAKQVELVRKGALLHDIGKLGMPTDILAKPSRLTWEEYEVVKRHAVLGAELVEKSPSLRPLVPIIRHHHEFFNGNGYPDKLKGNQISVEARIVAIADAIDAMSSNRPYRKALSSSSVISELKKHAGSQFDPLIVDKAIRMMEFQAGVAQADSTSSSELVGKLATSLPSS
jgi:putative nucleotidyltransferase with HDIG domain